MGRRITAVLNDQSNGRARSLQSEYATRAITLVLIGVSYYVAARLGLRLAVIHRNVTPLWPPTGIAVVAFLLFGRRVWPAIALAAFFVNEPISTSAWAAAATAAGNTVAPLAAAELLVRLHFRKELDRLRDAVAIVCVALLAMTISASVGSGTLVLSDAIPARDFLSAWAVWWTGDAMGVLVVAPFLLSLLLYWHQPRPSWGEWAEGAALLGGLGALAILVMRGRVPMMFLVLPILGLIAWRFQQRGSAPAALIVAGVASWAAADGWSAFARGTLFETMLRLQAFNATVAITSFVVAAVVTERMQDRDALERSAADLEERVRLRTTELSAANDLLTREITERKEAERRLRQRERQLADAQQVARMGSWEWLIPEGRVSWSDEMFRIHGFRPKEFEVTFDKAIELIAPHDRDRIQGNVAVALRKGKAHVLPPVEYRIVRPDGAERVLRGRSRMETGTAGDPLRMLGTVQDITDEKQAEREHQIAETLQRSLLPDRLPEIPGVQLAARYVAATKGAEVGGDWYDVLQLPNGHVGVAIGDVAGHGLRAAATMAQLRMAVRAYATEEDSPAEVVKRVNRLVQRLPMPEMATLIYLVFDPDSGRAVFSNAGHPAPLLIESSGDSWFLEGGLAPPLGVVAFPDHFVEAETEIPSGSTLLMFTDGLVEQRGVSIREGLERLKQEARAAGPDLDALCDHLLATLVEKEIWDDIALLAVRPIPFVETTFTLRMPAEPATLAPLRHTMRRWLREVGAGPKETADILVASGEACANAIQHAYGAREGSLEMTLSLVEGAVEVLVRDRGRWRHSSPAVGGRGLQLMRGLMDLVEIDTGSAGTTVRMRRRLGREDA